MDQDKMIQKIAERSGSSYEETRRFYRAMVEVFAETLGKGEAVECVPDFGRFIPKLRENPGRNVNSPRTPKKASYFIQFKAGRQFEYSLFSFSCSEKRDTGEEAVPAVRI